MSIPAAWDYARYSTAELHAYLVGACHACMLLLQLKQLCSNKNFEREVRTDLSRRRGTRLHDARVQLLRAHA